MENKALTAGIKFFDGLPPEVLIVLVALGVVGMAIYAIILAIRKYPQAKDG